MSARRARQQGVTPAERVTAELYVSHPIDDAQIELFHVRGVLDALHEGAVHAGGIFIEQVDLKSWSALFHLMIRKIDAASELLEKAPRHTGAQS